MFVLTPEEVDFVVKTAGLQGFAGNVRELGSGLLNYTYLLDCRPEPFVLRVAKQTQQRTLAKEAAALSKLDMPGVPHLVFFDAETRLRDRMWIVESHIAGSMVERLSPAQFTSLGKLLAQVHAVRAPETLKLHLWNQLLDSCKSFGTEAELLNHPNAHLRSLIQRAKAFMDQHQAEYETVQMSLIHGDATPSNLLVADAAVGLIDWEFATLSDPMREFSTVYYDDMDYNKGKWRIRITSEEKQALFNGYRAGGGVVDEARLAFWMDFDKLGAAIFLYRQLNDPDRPVSDEERAQYEVDLDTLIASMQRKLVLPA